MAKTSQSWRAKIAFFSSQCMNLLAMHVSNIFLLSDPIFSVSGDAMSDDLIGTNCDIAIFSSHLDNLF